jgi:hypothetical protein
MARHARRPKFYSKASGPVSRDALHAVLRGAEPAYRAHLDAVTGGAWQLREIEGPTENGETLVTWSDGLNDTVILYAIAVTESSVEVRLYVTTPAGPGQPHTGRVAVGQLGDPGAVFGRLHPPFPRGASENPSAFPPGARVLVDGRDEAIVKQAFPQGSSSYGFPHYKVDIVGGDRNVAVAMSRVGVKRRGASENPLDTSVDGWVHWHGDPPPDVGNLGPGQQVQTAAGHWYRQDGGVDAGKLYYKADPGTDREVEVIVNDAIVYREPDVESDRVGLAPELPPPGELPIGAVENPRRAMRSTTGGDLAGKAFKYLDVDWELSQDIPGHKGSDVYTALVDQGRYGGHGTIRVAVDGSWRDAATLLPVGETEPWITYVNRGRQARGISPLFVGSDLQRAARENPRRRKESNEFLQGLEAKKAARAAVFAALQSDPVYNRLFERKDAALRAWNQADAYKNTPSARPGEVEAAHRRAQYAMKQVNDYEDAALRKAGVAEGGASENPAKGGLSSLPPTGARVRLTGTFLKNTGQQRGGEGSKVWTVLGHSGDSFVIVDEEADTSYFTPEEIAADPSLKWRRINKANLQVVGAAPRAGDYP